VGEVTDTVHIPRKIELEEARARVARLDWPDTLAQSPESYSGELLWIPFEPKGACVAADGKWKKFYESGGVYVRRGRDAIEAGPPTEGTVVPAVAGIPLVYLPVWVLKSASGDWAAVEAFGGTILSGKAAARLPAARARLIFLSVLALFTISAEAGILKFVLGVVAGGVNLILYANWPKISQELIGRAIVAAACVPGVIWFSRRIPGAIFRALEEPSFRTATGKVDLPPDRDWLVLFERCGLAALFLAPFQLFYTLGVGGQNTVGRFDSTFFAFAYAPAVIMALFGWDAYQISRGKWLPAAAEPHDHPHVLPAGKVGDIVRLGCDITAFAAAGGLLGGLLTYGLIAFIKIPGLTPASCPLVGAEIGATLAVLFSPGSASARLPLIVGALSTIAARFLSPWLGQSIAFAAVLIAVVTESRWRRKGFASMRALRTALWFGLLGAAGRLAGRILGLFLLGPGFAPVGVLLFEQVASAAAVLGQREPDSRS
jgi:hypothetical protein